MPITIEPYLVAVAGLLIISVFASKISDRFGVPALALFVALGMLAGSDGLGGIYFDDASVAQTLGVIALAVILFSGGLETTWSVIRPVAKEGFILATLGVLITAVTLGVFVHFLLGVTLLEGVLIGAIVSSTDAAAVFAVLNAKGIYLKGRLKELLEFESGSNDPMAVFLTVSLAQLILQPEQSIWTLIPTFLLQMGLGVVLGLAFGKLALYFINRLGLGSAGLYPVLALAFAFFTYGVTTLIGGSGFLAVYLAGLVLGSNKFIHKHGLLRFFESTSWLMQIVMFFTLGLLVFPSRLGPIALPGLAIAAFLILVARPVSVFISLIFTKLHINDKLFISWVGLRGAVPIILAIYPRIMNLPQSDLIFNVIFFVVMLSVLVQGTSLSFIARRLGVEGEAPQQTDYPISFVPESSWSGEMKEIVIGDHSPVIGKAIYEVGLPGDYLVVMIARGEEFIVPNGSVVLRVGDKILGLSQQKSHEEVMRLINPTADQAGS